MDNEFEYIIKTAKNLKLKEDEKFLMRQNILNEKVDYSLSPYQYIRSSYFMFGRYKFAPAFIMILIIVFAGGTSAFAEKAVPGDLLYGIKISINEPVAGMFAFTKEEKTEWHERLVERRLAEAQKLVSKNNLNEAARTGLENQIKVQIDKFSADANELAWQKNESANSSDLNIRLQASLKAYQNVLATLAEETSLGADTKHETGKLLVALEASQNKVRDDHKDLELKGSPSALAKQTAALNLLNSTKLLYQKEKINLSENIQNKINDKLAEAEATLAEGKMSALSSDDINSIDKSKSAINSVNEAKLLMLSNVIKGDIEDEMGLDKEDSEDIEDNEDMEDNGLKEHENEDNLNSSDFEPDKIYPGKIKFDKFGPRDL